MGYYTEFNLISDKYHKRLLEIVKENNDIIGYDLKQLIKDGYIHAKWYSAKEELEEFTNIYQDVFIEIECIGEERDDRYTLYAAAGKVYQSDAIIKFELPPEDFLEVAVKYGIMIRPDAFAGGKIPESETIKMLKRDYETSISSYKTEIEGYRKSVKERNELIKKLSGLLQEDTLKAFGIDKEIERVMQ